MIKVSIIIPSFNSEKYIEAALESALAQTWSNIEVIVIDDGSVDNTFSIAERYTSEKVIVHKQENMGACAARNKGFSMSTGEFIQYLDADDVLDKNKVSIQMNALLSGGNNNVSFCPWGEFTDNPLSAEFHERPFYKSYLRASDLLLDMWQNKKMLQTSVWLTPRNLIEKAGGWNEQLLINQDGEFFCRVLLAADEAVFCNNALTFYRKGVSGSVSSNSNEKRKAASLLKSYMLYESNFASKFPQEVYKKGVSVNYFDFVYRYLNLFPDLARIALSQIKNLNVKPDESKYGGRLFKLLTSIFGFYNALKLRQSMQRLRVR